MIDKETQRFATAQPEEQVTVGEMKQWLSRYDDSISVDVYMLAEDKLPIVRLFHEPASHDGLHEWPMMVVAFRDDEQ